MKLVKTDDIEQVKLRDKTYWRFETKTPDSLLGRVTNLKHGVRLLKEQFQPIYKVFFPRVFTATEGYGDWRWPHYTHAFHFQFCSKNFEYYNGYEAARNMMVFSGLWLAAGLPHFFVGSEIFTACAKTQPPMDIPYDEFKMPHEAMVFTLPDGALKWRNNPVEYFGILRLKKGKHKIQLANPHNDAEPFQFEMDFQEDRFVIVTAVREQNVYMAASMSLQALQLVLETGGKGLIDTNDPHLSGIHATPKDAEFLANLLKLGLNIILAMEVQPDLLERERFKTMSKKDKRLEVWNPNVIGRKYRIKYSNGGVPEGTHASPRAHIRSGHWRRQGRGHRTPIQCLCGHGKQMHVDGELCMNPDCNCFKMRLVGGGFTEYEKIWLQPVWVNLKTDAAAV